MTQRNRVNQAHPATSNQVRDEERRTPVDSRRAMHENFALVDDTLVHEVSELVEMLPDDVVASRIVAVKPEVAPPVWVVFGTSQRVFLCAIDDAVDSVLVQCVCVHRVARISEPNSLDDFGRLGCFPEAPGLDDGHDVCLEVFLVFQCEVCCVLRFFCLDNVLSWRECDWCWASSHVCVLRENAVF